MVKQVDIASIITRCYIGNSLDQSLSFISIADYKPLDAPTLFISSYACAIT